MFSQKWGNTVLQGDKKRRKTISLKKISEKALSKIRNRAIVLRYEK